MAAIHEIIAAEGGVKSQFEKLLTETRAKFGKVDSFFLGNSKALKMVADSSTNPALAAEEQAAASLRPATTNVADTLGYFLKYYAAHEDLQFQKNSSNLRATADVMIGDEKVFTGLPIDELMGLEARLTQLRGLFAEIPTLDASKQWVADGDRGRGFYKSGPVTTVKMKKETDYQVIVQATEHHPAQVQQVSKDVVSGAFTSWDFSGALTSQKKADLLGLTDSLIIATRQARQRANATEAERGTIAQVLVDKFMAVLQG
jgi:hypothetical protein